MLKYLNNNNSNNNNNNNSIKFIYLRAWQQPKMANYSQAQKQKYRLTLKKNKRKYNVDTIRNLKGTNQ
jgi:hypothetical protein